MTTDKELIATLERANASYAHAFEQARAWQDVDPALAQTVLDFLQESMRLAPANQVGPEVISAIQVAANALAALRGLPHEVAAPTSAQSTARIKMLEFRLEAIVQIAAGKT